MYQHTFSPEPIRICSIDPGSDTMGIAFIDLDLTTLEINVIEVDTYNALKAIRQYFEYETLVSRRTQRIAYLESVLSDLLHNYRPNLIIAEAPYMGRFATAFETLVEVRMMMYRAVEHYCLSMPMETIDPMTVKERFGVAKKGSNKEDMQRAICERTDIVWTAFKRPHELDSHSADAVAVGLWRAYGLRDYYGEAVS